MKKTGLLLFLLLIIIRALNAQVDYDSCILRISKNQLIDELARYQEDWKNDSLANNGFRRFFGMEFFRCAGKSLVGTQWSSISQYIGKPHFVFKENKNFLYSKDEILYRYVLFTYSDYQHFKDIGNIILDVIVVNGIIRFLGVQENDG